jgi:putative transposase
MGRKSKFSEADIIGAIRDIEGGTSQTEVARRMGVTTQTMLRWRAKYGGMTVSEAQEKRRIEEENRKLRRMLPERGKDRARLRSVRRLSEAGATRLRIEPFRGIAS